jgi:predicted nucleic acid-binding protein
MMQKKIFLDANILLDLLLKREGYENSRGLFEAITAGLVKGYTSVSVLHILAYWLQKAYGLVTAKKLLLSLSEEVAFIDCSHASATNALHSPFPDIEDAIQYQTAIQHKVHFFITRDKGIIRQSAPILPALLPKAFLDTEL